MTPDALHKRAEVERNKSKRLTEALEGLLSALSPLSVMGHPIASLNRNLADKINLAVTVVAYVKECDQ